MMNQLEQIKQWSQIVIDTGNVEAVSLFAPQDATTNPSLILKATSNDEYSFLIKEAADFGKSHGSTKKRQIELALDKLFVNFGREIINQISGRISTEADPRLSFDVEGTIQKAKDLVSLYEKEGIEGKRILIKIASTWEGILAAKELERDGIHCNMTLIFSLPQAIACANAKASLISPFIGRILDWYKLKGKWNENSIEDDPGVQSVKKIYAYLKKFGYSTQIMGASFRNKEQILALAGLDLLTISPVLLKELTSSSMPITKKLSDSQTEQYQGEKILLDEKTFRFLLNEDAMASEKLAEGIRTFVKDIRSLENFIYTKYF